jgi:ADP-ribosylglycohydrolase
MVVINNWRYGTMNQTWLLITRDDLAIELQQLCDEGKDTSSVESEFHKLRPSDVVSDQEFQSAAQALLDKAQELPLVSGYKYVEPNDLREIRDERSDGPRRFCSQSLSEEEAYDRFLGAWLGRCAGCLLGKPVEGWHTDKMWGYLKDMGRYPLSDYFISEVPAEIGEKYKVSQRFGFIDQVNYMPEDDDTNYTVTGLAIVKRHGTSFSSEDIADFWLSNIPLLKTCTAERVAYRNFALTIPPPRSATHRNPYREWIGAQIRGDFFGYAALGNPELAAELAWRDARVSHVKNGIYGEMWVAAVLAAAAFEKDPKSVIQIGLSEIPARSRLYEAISDVISWYDKGLSRDEATSMIHKRWNQYHGHHWCHTISNAQIVAMGLLWSDLDFEQAICGAVQACFDTDCNGATVGSIMGMMMGANRLPERWISPLNDTLETGVSGYHRVSISDLARQTLELHMSLG